MPSVFHHHRQGDARVIDRGIGDEEGMIALALRDLFFLVGLLLADGEDLGRAGLAGDAIGRAADALGGAPGAFHHLDHGLDHVLQVTGVQAQRTPRGGDGLRLVGARLHALGHPRLHVTAAIGQGGSRRRQLQGRGEEGALTDADDQGLAGVPGLVAHPAPPLPGGEETAQFSRQIDPGFAAKMEFRQEIAQPVDPQVMGEIVVVDITGFDDGPAQVHGPMPPLAPVPIAMGLAGQLVMTATMLGLARGDDAVLQPRQGDEGFDGGPGWILAAQGAVEQGHVGIIAQGGIFLGADPLDEGVGIEAGIADQGQDAASARVQGSHGAAPLAQGRRRVPLQADVQVQAQVLAGHRRLALQGAQDPALGVHLHLAISDLAMEHRLVGLFQPILADEVRAPVGALVDALEFLLVDPSDVTQYMPREGPLGIGPQQVGADIHLGKAVALQGEAGDLLLGEMQAQGDRLIGGTLAAQAFEALEVRLGDGHDRPQLREQRPQVLGLVRGHGQGEGGLVGRQGHAVGVVDQPPHRRQGLQPHPVVLGEGGKMLVPVDLQLGDPRHHQQQEEAGQNGRDPGAAGEGAAFSDVGMKPGAGHEASESRPAAPGLAAQEGEQGPDEEAGQGRPPIGQARGRLSQGPHDPERHQPFQKQQQPDREGLLKEGKEAQTPVQADRDPGHHRQAQGMLAEGRADGDIQQQAHGPGPEDPDPLRRGQQPEDQRQGHPGGA